MEMDFLAAVNMRCPVRRVKRGVAPRMGAVTVRPAMPEDAALVHCRTWGGIR